MGCCSPPTVFRRIQCHCPKKEARLVVQWSQRGQVATSFSMAATCMVLHHDQGRKLCLEHTELPFLRTYGLATSRVMHRHSHRNCKAGTILTPRETVTVQRRT